MGLFSRKKKIKQELKKVEVICLRDFESGKILELPKQVATYFLLEADKECEYKGRQYTLTEYFLHRPILEDGILVACDLIQLTGEHAGTLYKNVPISTLGAVSDYNFLIPYSQNNQRIAQEVLISMRVRKFPYNAVIYTHEVEELYERVKEQKIKEIDDEVLIQSVQSSVWEEIDKQA